MAAAPRFVRAPIHRRYCRPLFLVLLVVVWLCSCVPLSSSISTGGGATATAAGLLNDYTITSASYAPTLSSVTHSLTTTTFTTNETPNLALTLPFTFPYWSSTANVVYANPNGAVQFDNSYPCCTPCETMQGECCSFMNYNLLIETPNGPVSTCSFALSYNDLVAPFLTDLAPAYPTPMVNGPQLVYGYDRNALVFSAAGNGSSGSTATWNHDYPYIIQYKNIPLNGQTDVLGLPFLNPYGVTMTFGVGLYITGRIDFYYWNVSDPINYDGWGGLERLLLVGLRQQQGQSQQNAYLAQYYDPNTGVLPSNGTYLPRAGVKSNTTWTFWPIGSSSCVGPVYATNSGSMLRIVLKDYSNSTSQFNWTCRFIDTSTNLSAVNGEVAGVYNVFNNEIDCMAPPAAVNATYHIELLASTLYGLVQLPIDQLSVTYVSNRSRLADSLTAPLTSIQSLTQFCSSCAAFRPTVCWYDCSGTLHGSAYTDNCGTCVGGTTGRTFDDALDCNGVCYGPFVQLFSGECVCAGGGECNTLVQSTLYVSDQSANYLYSINASVLSGTSGGNTSLGAANGTSNGGDPQVAFDDDRFIELPYTFTIQSDPFPFYLNFYFPYMGNMYNLVYISPMGGIYLSVPSQACMAHASLAHFDGSNNCQYQMIAGYMAEFDAPTTSYVEPDWSYITNSHYFAARFTNMHLAETSDVRAYVSFSIVLYPTGRVTVNHYDVIPIAQIAQITGLPYTRKVLVGMVTTPRSIGDMQSVYPSPFVALSARGNGIFALGVEQQWRPTTVSTGIYPLPSVVRSGQTIDFIPFETNVCLSPYFGSSTGGQLMHINPQLSSPYLPYLTLACAVNNVLYPASYNTTYQSFDCVLPAGLPYTAVTVGLGAWDTLSFLTINRVYYEYYNASDSSIANYSLQYSTDSFCDHCYNGGLGINTRYCYVDCADDWRGGAYLDDCGSCVGGLTGQLPDEAKDCYGTCFGSFHSSVTVDGGSACVCQLGVNQTARQSGCTNVPIMRPSATVFSQYVDGFTTAAANTPLPVAVANNASLTLLAVDAAGLVPVDLNFSFPWFGTSYRRVFIDEFGAVFLTNTTAACEGYGNVALWNNNATCLYSLIAAAFTPFYTPVPTTAYTLTSTTLSVVWMDGNQSFSLTLDSGGGVAIDYRNVQQHSNDWLVGVRLGVPSALLMPFPFFITAASYTSNCGAYTCLYTNLPQSYLTPNELSYLPAATYTSGYYPTRSRFASPTNGRLSFCPFDVTFCLSPQSGPVRGGTLVTFYNSATTCLTASNCCYLSLNVTCSWGGLIVPANYSMASQSWQCVAPPGVRNSVVSVWLEESGRRIGMAEPLFYTYNNSAVPPQSTSDVALLTCVNCASVLSTYCWQDCTGTYRGNATSDTCGVCQPPALTTAVTMSAYVATAADYPYQSALDCMGVCYGPFDLYGDNATNFLPHSTPLPQCGCTVTSESSALQRYAFPYTVLCAVWEKVEGGSAVRDTLNALHGYQIFVLVVVLLVLVCALWVETARWARYVKRRMKMTPAERERERRRRERRRQRERDRRERRRRLELGLPLPHQQALPPGVAVMPVPPPPPSTDAHEPPTTATTNDTPIAATTVTTATTTAAHTRNTAATNTNNMASSIAGGGGSGSGDGMTAGERTALTQLHAMGFNDDSVLLPLIRKCHGDANAVINRLLR